MKDKNRPQVVDCSQCGRTLSIKDYDAIPNAATPKERIHEYRYRNAYNVSVLCSCGHYTRHIRIFDNEH